MKKQFLAVILMLAFFSFSGTTLAQVHVYVRVQPVAPVILRPAAPAPDHIWVEHEYVVRNGEYVHVPGYWAVPPRGRVKWVPGHWRNASGHGYYWVPGHWV